MTVFEPHDKADPPSKSVPPIQGEVMTWRIIGAFVVALMLLLASIAGIAALIALRSRSSVEVYNPGIEVMGNTVIVNAELKIPQGKSMTSNELYLTSGGRTFPVHISDGLATVEMSGPDLAGMIDNGSAELEGRVELDGGLPLFRVKTDVRRSIDLSFIEDLNMTMEVGNITLNFSGLGQIRIVMDLYSSSELEVWVKAWNTSATISTAFSSFSGFIEELYILNNGTGHVSVLIPTLAILPLSFGRNRISVEFYGIEFEFRYPIV